MGFSIADKLSIFSNFRARLHTKVMDVFVNEVWHFLHDFQVAFPDICNDIRSIKSSYFPHDIFVYRGSSDGLLSYKEVYHLYQVSSPKVA